MSPGFNPSQQRLLRVCARLVLLALIFQVFAFDHWRGESFDASAVTGNSQHALHCHGNASGCADSVAPSDLLASSNPTPLPPAPVLQSVLEPTARPAGTFYAVRGEPPRVS